MKIKQKLKQKIEKIVTFLYKSKIIEFKRIKSYKLFIAKYLSLNQDRICPTTNALIISSTN